MKNKQRLVASILIAMRITIAQMAITIVFASSLYAKEVKSQNILEKKFSISVENKQLKKVISEIQKQTKVKFSFSANAIDAERMISFSALEKKIAEFLDETLRPYDIGYQVINERIVLFPEKRTERLVENVATAEEKIIALEKVITGAVVNDLGEPMESVSVSEKGTSNGVTTNKNGEFRISVADNNAVLVFSYVGYESKEMAVTNQVIMRVSLKAIPKAIEEVIVVGYGTQKVTKVSGAISTIKSADIDKLKPFRAEEALQGRASGVSVIQRGGPGKAPTILIRGIPSFSGTDPVVIVDGVPGSLETLSSDDIESINVLKDAASTAIYGVKGGNGVIVVTTKTGRKNRKTEFSFSANVGQQQLMNKIDVLNAEQYGIIINEGQVNSGKPIVFQDVKSLGVGTDWQDVIFKDAGVSQYSLAARGGSEKTTYYFSASYLDQAGIVGGADKNIYKRATITSNLTFNLTKKLDFIFNTAYTNTQGKSVQEGSFNAIIGNALNFDPTVPIYNTDPRYVGKYAFSNLIINELYNPAYKLENQYNKANTDRVNGKVELQYSILKNLKLTSRIGYAQGTSVGKSFGPFVFYGPKHKENSMDSTGTPISGKYNSVSESTNTSSYYTFETFGEYKYTLKDIHNFDAVAGYSLARSTGYGFSASRQGVPFNSWAYADISAATGVNSATNTNASGGSSTQNLTRRNLSYFGRINYDYKDKYLASFSARRDGSIAFGPKNKFANFFAGSVGWVATKEDFFKVDFIDYLKIRSSYGSIGNENVSPQYVGVVTGGPSYSTIVNSNGYTFGGVFIPGSTIGSFVNEVLRWEKQIQFNAGFDIRVLKNKVSLSADYFTKAVDGLLFNDPPSLYAGTSQQVASNIGTTETKGFDLSLGYNTLIGKDFKFNTSVNFTTSNNMVTATNTDGTAFYSGGSYFNGVTYNSTRFAKGFTPGHFYGFKTDGLFQNAAEIAASPTQTNVAPGDIKFVDANGDGKISDLDKVQIGDPFPDYTIGWNLGFEFKNFEFTMFTYLSQGNDVYRAYERNDVYTNKWAGILNRWTGEGTTNDARYPRHVTDDKNANWRVSDRFIEDGSFVKIKNVMLGYTVPPSLYKNKLFSKILVYVQVKNLLTITKASGYDPELGGGIMETGVDRGNYPQARTIAAGIDIRF